jgi:prepilin-type N-terminal cleavage/methylation domain-containing protein
MVRKLKVRSKRKSGFTLIELMIVVAIIGILAALAIPAYTSYTKRSRMSEVLIVFDALAQGASEYHAAMGYFPNSVYGPSNLALFSDLYADLYLVDQVNPNVNIGIIANFKSTLDLDTIDASSSGYGELMMIVAYNTVEGYSKSWALSQSNLDAIFIPKGGH